MIGVEDDGTSPDTNDFWILFRKGNGDTIGSVQGTGTDQVAFQTSSDQTLKMILGLLPKLLLSLMLYKFINLLGKTLKAKLVNM